jgi:molecular chaperone DnaK
METTQSTATHSADKRDRIIVGIDLGTTNSVVAYTAQGKASVITTPEGERFVPSAVAYT